MKEKCLLQLTQRVNKEKEKAEWYKTKRGFAERQHKKYQPVGVYIIDSMHLQRPC